MSEYIQPLLKDHIVTMRICRPERKNALTHEMYSEMTNVLKYAATNIDARVVLIAGVPNAFTSGNDLQDFLKNPPTGHDAPVARFMHELAGFPKPVVAAVAGVAVGIGVTMLLHCDLVYLGQNARLQMPFASLGICPEFASSYILPRILGHVRAAELLMLGEPVSANKALELGLANAVLPDAEVEHHAFERAMVLSRQPPNALRVTKELLRRWSHSTVSGAIDVELDHLIRMLGQPEATEIINAIGQKRKPDISKMS